MRLLSTQQGNKRYRRALWGAGAAPCEVAGALPGVLGTNNVPFTQKQRDQQEGSGTRSRIHSTFGAQRTCCSDSTPRFISPQQSNSNSTVLMISYLSSLLSQSTCRRTIKHPSLLIRPCNECAERLQGNKGSSL